MNNKNNKTMRLIYMIATDVLRALGWEVEINEKESYWNLVLTSTTSSEDMPESHKSCLRGLLRGWLMEFNFEGGRQQVNIYKELHGLDPEDDRYSCLDTCVKRTDSNTPQYKLNDREVFVRRKDRFDRYVLAEPVSENITTKPSTEQEAENLTDDSDETATDAPEAGQDTLDPSMAAMAASFELDKPLKASWMDNAVKTIDRMISWMLYTLTFCFLLGVAGLDLSAREIIAYSLMLGLVVGSINNIERVMRELFRKED